jgi:glycerophosphoryl diester phosphodiesterase
MKQTTRIIFCILLASCTVKKNAVQNISQNKITVLGHGGTGIGHILPMNSIRSVTDCLSSGADGTEMDVQVSKDSVPVLFHDKDLSDHTNLEGKIHSLDWQYISTAFYRDPLGRHHKIYSLELLLHQLEHLNDKTISLDCKDDYAPDTSESYRLMFCRAIGNVIEKYRKTLQIQVEMKQENFMHTFQKLYPGIKIFACESFDTAFAMARRSSLSGIVVSVRNITAEQVKLAHENNLQVILYNTHSRSSNREAIRKNADMIETDNVRYLVRLLH